MASASDMVIALPELAKDLQARTGVPSSPVRTLGFANPELAPYGRAAQQALERSGLWKDVQSKVVVAKNIRQAMQMAETGNVDAALTSLSLLSGIHGETVLNVPGDLYDQIQQEAGIISRADGNHHDAQAFPDYLISVNGRAILLQRYGFGIPISNLHH